MDDQYGELVVSDLLDPIILKGSWCLAGLLEFNENNPALAHDACIRDPGLIGLYKVNDVPSLALQPLRASCLNF